MSAKATSLYILVAVTAALAGFFSGRASVKAPALPHKLASAPTEPSPTKKNDSSSWVFDNVHSPKKVEGATSPKEAAPATNTAQLPIDTHIESSTVYETISEPPPEIARIEAARLGKIQSSDQFTEVKDPPPGMFIATMGPDGQPRLKLTPQ